MSNKTKTLVHTYQSLGLKNLYIKPSFTKIGFAITILKDYTKPTIKEVKKARISNIMEIKDFHIPKLNPNVVNQELLSIQDVAKALGENETTLRKSLAKINLTSYHIRNTELIKRAELNKFLRNSPVNGFTKCPNQLVSCV